MKLFVSSDVQASTIFSDAFARLECELNQFQSAIQTPKTRAAALATVDQDIDAAKRLILSILTRRNTLVPISVLPAEVLARIFHFVAFSEQPHSRVWVRVTHVCRGWRQIALDDSTLWTHFSPFPRNRGWIAERLSRARNAPLVIELDGWLGKDTLSLFTPHISHTRELYLNNLSSFHPQIVQEIGIQNAPVLECLELGMSNLNFPMPMDIKHVVGHFFFKGPLPKLRILRISQMVFPWSIFPRGQLTQLKVTLVGEVPTVTSKDSQHDDMKQLIDLLIDCPALEVLTLENCLPAMLSESSGGQTIHFPRLSRLCLRGSSSRVTNLLKILKLSSAATLRLICTSENTETHNDYHILPILSEHFNDLNPVKFRRFEVNLDDEDDVIRVVASTCLTLSPVPYIHPELSLSFHSVAELNNRVDILRRTCDVLSLSTIEFLSMHFSTPKQFINCNEIFQHCTEVTTVKVSGRGTIGLLQVLTPLNLANTTVHGKPGKSKCGDNGRGAQAHAPNDDDNDGPATVHVSIFPKLTSLLLEMLYFTDAVPGSGILYDLVMSAVQLRKANKTPLTTLYIDNCVIPEEQTKALETLVPDFRWDHDEGHEDCIDNEYGGWPDDFGHLNVGWGGDAWEHEW